LQKDQKNFSMIIVSVSEHWDAHLESLISKGFAMFIESTMNLSGPTFYKFALEQLGSIFPENVSRTILEFATIDNAIDRLPPAQIQPEEPKWNMYLSRETYSQGFHRLAIQYSDLVFIGIVPVLVTNPVDTRCIGDIPGAHCLRKWDFCDGANVFYGKTQQGGWNCPEFLTNEQVTTGKNVLICEVNCTLGLIRWAVCDKWTTYTVIPKNTPFRFAVSHWPETANSGIALLPQHCQHCVW
jgi:hypothetical protein